MFSCACCRWSLQVIPYEQNPHWSDTPFAHGFFGRLGGVSQPPYDSLNIGKSTKDDDAHIQENRRRIAAKLGITNIIHPGQVHGTDILDLSNQIPTDHVVADAVYNPPPSAGLAIQTADCMPVLFAHRKEGVLAGAHAGWRGFVDGILEKMLMRFEQDGLKRWDISVAIGPAIGPGAFEVGEEVVEALPEICRGLCSFRHFQTGRWHVDLRQAASIMLRQGGVQDIWASHSCTYTDQDRYFSHRHATHHNGGITGRQVAIIGWPG